MPESDIVGAVKHLTMSEKSLLLGDEAADLLITYAALIAQIRRGDHVTLHAIGPDGDELEVTFLLNPGTVLVVETTNTSIPAPDNSTAIACLRDRLAGYGVDLDDRSHPFDARMSHDSDGQATGRLHVIDLKG